MQRITRLLITLTAVGVMFMVLSGNALAKKSDNPPAKVVPGSPSLTATVVGARASANDIATGRITVLADMGVKPSVRPGSARCYWTHGGFWNSGRAANGKSYSFWDPVPGKLCPSKKSKTGWVKVAGGKSGRNCGNVASAKRPPFKVVTGKVLMVRSFVSVRINLRASVKVAVSCDTGTARASADGRGSASINISLKQYMRARGAVQTGLFIKANGIATANANARAECSVPVAPPPVVIPPPPVTPPTPPAPPVTPPSPPSPPQPPPTDVCPNLPGAQSSIPAGYVKDINGNCVIPPPPPTDVCPNLEGVQTTVPAGYIKDAAGNCVIPPPPAQPPSLSNLTQPQEVFSDGETYPNINVTASAKNGDSITVSCGAQYGSMTGSQTFTSGGVNTLSFTYTAPNTPDAAGRTENISCTVHDNTTGLNGNTVSVSFPIMKPPANP